MSKQTRTVLKGYFQTGDIPTESQYVDFIDSKLNLSENNTGNIQLTGNITASSNISSSATIIGNSGSFESVAGTLSTAAQPNITSLGTLTSVTTGDVTATGNSVLGNAVTDTHTLTGNITSSGNISSSGNIITNNLNIDNSITATGNISGSVTSTGSFGTINTTHVNSTNIIGTLQTAAQTNITSVGTLDSLTVTGDITANGNIVGDDGTDITNIETIECDNIVHDGDTDTKIEFTTDQIDFTCGGEQMLRLDESAQDKVEINSGLNDIDFQVNSNGKSSIIKVLGENGYVGIDKSVPEFRLDVQANNGIRFSSLTTSDPGVAGQLYNDGGTLKISAG